MLKFIDKINIPSDVVFFYDIDSLSSHTLEGLISMLDKRDKEDWYDITMITPSGSMYISKDDIHKEAKDMYEFQKLVEEKSRIRRLIISGELDEIFCEICTIYDGRIGYDYSFDLGYMYGDYPEYTDHEAVRVPYGNWWDPEYRTITEFAEVSGKSDTNIYPRPIYKDGFIGYLVCPADCFGIAIGAAYDNLMTFPTALLRKIL